MKKIIVIFLFITCCLSLIAAANAEVLERIVAIVNDDIILFSEYQDALRAAVETDPPLSRDRVLNDMIDHMLLLNEAEKYRTSVSDKTQKSETDNRVVISEYIDRRIKALIHVPYEDIERYYQMNMDMYRDKAIIDVRNDIEALLAEAELKTKLREHLEELRKVAYIRIQLNAEN